MSDKSIPQLLDEHLLVLQAMGLELRFERPGPPRVELRKTLQAAGINPIDDLLDFLGWASIPDPNVADFLVVFPWLLSQDHALDLWSLFHPEFSDDDGWFPGPASFFPLAFLDGAQYLAIDTDPHPDRCGRIWACFQSYENQLVFESLAEAIETATYSLLSGLWWVQPDGWSLNSADA